ncbi:hypothetical protein PENFLA_c032G00665 [Penicillium flavigenum]|uniref:Uncharacterized protein n=1 Tax=Penicillium flavigenum TaxID=254877 RepID=A0A1V6SMW9_9EURO|nr:hypothetical protein PENFLA_c032G00665 [Penicillium flavigenum]
MASDRVILLSPGRSWRQESQAIGRCLRVTSLYPVTAVPCFVPNSYDQFRFMKQAAKASLQLAVNSGERPLQEIMVKLLNNIQPQVNACYASEYGQTLIKQKSEADAIRKAALNAYLTQEPAQWAKAAKEKLDSDGGGFTGPDIELLKRRRKETPTLGVMMTRISETEDELFDTIDLGRSLGKILTLKFNAHGSWKEFADRRQPDDNTRYLMALLEFPGQKSCSVDDLKDSGYLHLGLLLLYNHIRDIPTVHLESSIHIQYPDIPEEVVGTNKAAGTLKGPKMKEMEEFLKLDCGGPGLEGTKSCVVALGDPPLAIVRGMLIRVSSQVLHFRILPNDTSLLSSS